MEKNDWRLTNQINYMKNLKFVKKAYDGVDHDHCSFCWEKFGYNEGNLTIGYNSEDKKFWVCEDCFSDFKADFNFKIKDNSDLQKS